MDCSHALFKISRYRGVYTCQSNPYPLSQLEKESWEDYRWQKNQLEKEALLSALDFKLYGSKDVAMLNY